ncbi:MAG: hypothetical protein GTN62_00220 [Gemmatimonadales bacterium]|nr:hypothetical protein [Gemmatimonadales bacterium]NIN09830.1 hypothetical protein [Gemmatimonadales bacterium]NIN48533.1 hypothetical protein [Gemmatimonadales bacterium]NIP05997.1 hypothetical protein [Gemmatimonadales bacterium]NIR01147.1 hypothetical protein [Gemmatimonadales bacterium]
MIFPSRRRRRRDKYLPWKTGALVIGAVLILLAYRVANRWLAWVAIAVLAVGFLLRFLPQETPEERSDNDG